MPPRSDDDPDSPRTVSPVLWSMERAPGSGHYHVGFRTAAGERVVVQLRAADILGMADAVLNSPGDEVAHPPVQ